MDITEIENLIDLVIRANVTEVTLRTEDRRITVRRALSPSPLPKALALQPALPAPLVEFTPAAAAEPGERQHWIKAPMVGIFHHAEPPVSPGVKVEAGQIVGSIESMKLMNDIRTEESGVVVESLAEAGMAVEYDQNLFNIAVQEG
jgi:acetyl-CoA carboxylase biotin carboxyl carrier protein